MYEIVRAFPLNEHVTWKGMEQLESVWFVFTQRDRALEAKKKCPFKGCMKNHSCSDHYLCNNHMHTPPESHMQRI